MQEDHSTIQKFVFPNGSLYSIQILGNNVYFFGQQFFKLMITSIKEFIFNSQRWWTLISKFKKSLAEVIKFYQFAHRLNNCFPWMAYNSYEVPIDFKREKRISGIATIRKQIWNHIKCILSNIRYLFTYRNRKHI